MRANVKQIERRRLTDQIIEQVTSLIEKGKLKEGDKLPPERVLMQQFGVGRSSLREALGALSLTGVLSVQPGRGTHVTVQPNGLAQRSRIWHLLSESEKIEELAEVRIILEVALAGLAAKKATEEDISKMSYYHEQVRISGTNFRKRIQADMSFHLALAEASHNDILVRFILEIQRPMRLWMEQVKSIVGYSDAIARQHDEILAATKERDAEKAKSVMQEHLGGSHGLTRIIKEYYSQKAKE